MKSLKQHLRDYVDEDEVTLWNLSKAFVKERFWDLVKSAIVLAALSVGGGLIGTNYFQNFNNTINKVENDSNGLLFNYTADLKRGLISENDSKVIQSKLDKTKINYWKNITGSLTNKNYSQAWENFSEYVSDVMHPDQIQARAGDAISTYTQIRATNQQKVDDMNSVLNELNSTNCSENSLQHYNSALKVLIDSDLPTQDYELRFERANTKCGEINYFTDLSNKMFEARKTLAAQNLSPNEIANELEMYFANHVQPVKEMTDLEARTLDLSKQLSAETGYGMDLENYLTTSQK